MIKDIFLPARINNYFLFDQNRLGLEITKSSLSATLLNISGARAVVKDFFHVPVTKKDDENTEDSIVIALKTLQQKVNQKSQLYLTLPNSSSIFQELTLPFLKYEQIKHTLPYELESRIPFALKDVLFDFIITKQNVAEKTSTVLVGLTPHKDADYYAALLEKAGYSVQNITFDLFALYTMYTANPTYSTLNFPLILLDLNFAYTSVIYLREKQITGIRTINQGIGTLAKNVAEKTGDSMSQVLEFIVRFGFGPTDKATFDSILEQELKLFCQQIQISLEGFAAQITSYEPPQKIITLSRNTILKFFDSKLSEFLSIPAEAFNSEPLTPTKSLKLSRHLKKIPLNSIISLGAAYPFTQSSAFNLLKYQKTPAAFRILKYQLITLGFLITSFLGLAVGYSYWQYSRATQQINNAKKTALNALKKEFEITDRNLNTAVNSAQEKLNESKAIWEEISGKRTSFLKYLEELSVLIDRESLGLELTKLTLTPTSITLKAQVRSYSALTKLKEVLSESTLFALASIPPQEPKFEIKLTIKNEVAS